MKGDRDRLFIEADFKASYRECGWNEIEESVIDSILCEVGYG